MSTIYLVVGSWHDDEGGTAWPVKAFHNETAANVFSDRLNTETRVLGIEIMALDRWRDHEYRGDQLNLELGQEYNRKFKAIHQRHPDPQWNGKETNYEVLPLELEGP